MEEIKRLLEKASVDYVEIHIEEYEKSYVDFNGKVLKSAGKSYGMFGNIRAFHRGGWGFSSFTELKGLEKKLREAEKMARLTSSKKGGLKSLKPVKKTVRIRLPDDPRRFSLEEKKQLAEKYNKILLSNKGVFNTVVGYLDHFDRRWIFNTEGTEIMEERIYTGVRMTAFARDGTNVQTAFDSYGEQEGFNSVTSLERMAEDVAKIAVDLLKAEKVEGGKYTVILDPKLAGVFIHEAFGHLSEADHVFENRKLFEIMKIGKRFGPDNLNVIDDGKMYGLRGSYHFDDEGTPARKTYLIKNGKLTGRLHSKETAYLLGEEPTGNARAIDYTFPPIVRMSCTYIDNGDTPFEEMISDIKKGIYAVAAYGGQTELEMFTFSAARGYLIENGKIKKMLRDVVLTGNVFETLMNIEMIGNDLHLFGGLGGCGKNGQAPLPVSDGAPHIRIKDVIIGGEK